MFFHMIPQIHNILSMRSKMSYNAYAYYFSYIAHIIGIKTLIFKHKIMH